MADSYTQILREIVSAEPTVIGNYTIIRLLGEGSFGKIYLAIHTFTRSKVVLKAASKHDPQLVREIHHHRLFKHPHIAQFYEFIITESRVWLVIEYCPNEDLYSYLIKHRRLSLSETRRLFAQICGAVAYTHSKNCAHRDLKLENILLNKNNDAKLSDFGFTREYTPPSLLETICGTTCYMAPEMLLRKKYSGETIDVWSLGVICYTLIYGEMPFEEDTDTQTRIKVLTQEPTYPDSEITGPLLDLLKSMLSKDPRQRPSLTEILQSPWLASEGALQIEILNEREYPLFTSKSEQRLLRIFRASQFDTDAIRESVSQSKCDALAGTWALALHRELKIENRRLRHRNNSYHHHHHHQHRSSLSFSRYSLSRNNSTHSKTSILRKPSTSSRRSSSIGRAGSLSRHGPQIYLNSNASNQAFSKSSLEISTKELDTHSEGPEHNQGCIKNYTKLTKAPLILSQAQDLGNLNYVTPQLQCWSPANNNVPSHARDVEFTDTFANTNATPSTETKSVFATVPSPRKPGSEYVTQSHSPKSPASKNKHVEKNLDSLDGSSKRTLQEIFRGSFYNDDSAPSRSSISLPIPDAHHSDHYSTPQFVDITDDKNPSYASATFIPVNASYNVSKDHFGEEMIAEHAKRTGKHGWGRLNPASKSFYSTVSSNANESKHAVMAAPDKKNKKFVTVVKNAWMKLVVPGATVNRKRSSQMLGHRESAATPFFGVHSPPEGKESLPGSPVTLLKDESVYLDGKLTESTSIQSIGSANKFEPKDSSLLNKTPIAPSGPASGVMVNTEPSPKSPDKASITSSSRQNDDTITSLLPQIIPITAPHDGDTNTGSFKGSSGSGKNTNYLQINGPSSSLARGAVRQRPVSGSSQFSTVSGISQLSSASSQVSSNCDGYSFSEVSFLNVPTGEPNTSGGSKTLRRHHSTGTAGTVGSIWRPYMDHRSTSSSFSSIQSYTTPRGVSSTANPGTNGSTFTKTHRPTHSKASSLSSLSIHSGFSSAFPKEMGPHKKGKDTLSHLMGSQYDENATNSQYESETSASNTNTEMLKRVNSDKAEKIRGNPSRKTHHRYHKSVGGTSSSSFHFSSQASSSSVRMRSPDSVRSLYSSGSLLSLKSATSTISRRNSYAQRTSRGSFNRAQSLSRKDSQNSVSTKGSVSRAEFHSMARRPSREFYKMSRRPFYARDSSLSPHKHGRSKSLNPNLCENLGKEPLAYSSFSKQKPRGSGKNYHFDSMNASNSDLSITSSRSSGSKTHKTPSRSLGNKSHKTSRSTGTKPSIASGGLGFETVPQRPGSPFISPHPSRSRKFKQTNTGFSAMFESDPTETTLQKPGPHVHKDAAPSFLYSRSSAPFSRFDSIAANSPRGLGDARMPASLVATNPRTATFGTASSFFSQTGSAIPEGDESGSESDNMEKDESSKKKKVKAVAV